MQTYHLETIVSEEGTLNIEKSPVYRRKYFLTDGD